MSSTSRSAGRCRARRSATDPSSARPWASHSIAYYAEFEWPDQDSFKAGVSSAEFAATGQDAMAMGRRFSVEFATARGALGKPRFALLAHGRNALVHVGPRQVEELERKRRVEGGPGGAQPVVEGELRVADRRLGAFGESRRDLERALTSSSSSATQSETSPMRSASMPSIGSQSSRWYFAFASPQSSGQTIAAWSPAATPSFVWPSTIRAAGVAIEMSASSPTARPAPTAGPGHRRDDRLGQPITL